MKKTLLALLLGYSAFAFADEALLAREEVQEYIRSTALEHGFVQAELADLFVRIETKPNIIDIFDRPSTGRPWYQFRANFLNPSRIQAGARF